MNDDGQLTDAPELFSRIASGDEAAFRELFELYVPRLQAMALRITGSAAVADDLVQETFLKVWIARDQLTGLEQPGAWVRKICFFLAVNHVRRQAVRDKVMDHIAHEKDASGKSLPVAEMVEFRQLLSLVGDAVDRLPEKQRRIYRLSREEALTISEIADRMGLASSTVKNLMVMALKNIRATLQNAGYPLSVLVLIDILL